VLKATVKIDDNSIDNFKNRTYTTIKASDCNSVTILVNGRDYSFDNNKKIGCFKLSKNVSGYNGAGGIGISVGGFVLQEIDDNLLRKLITEQYSWKDPQIIWELDFSSNRSHSTRTTYIYDKQNRLKKKMVYMTKTSAGLEELDHYLKYRYKAK